MGGFRRLGDPFAQNLKRLGSPNRQHGFLFNQFASFEAGARTPNPTGFDAITGPANLAVNAAAAIRGNFGLQVTLAGVGSESYGSFNGFNNNKLATLELYFDPRNLIMAGGDEFFMVVARGSGADPVTFSLELSYDGADLSAQLNVSNDTPAVQSTGFAIISNQVHFLRIEWKASSGALMNDGFGRYYIDGQLIGEISNIDNDTFDIDTMRVGAIFGIDAGTSGTLYFDDIGWADHLR